MRIAAITIDDYKRVRHIKIIPDADSHVILIGGRNKQGKSSTIDAIDAVLRGAKAIAADPVRHGADVANIKLELDSGLVVERTIESGAVTELVVSDADGPVRRPQELLDRLVGSRFIDPLEFLRKKGPEQREALMKVIPGAAEIRQLDERRERSFRQRTDVNRQLAQARGELARLPPAAEPLEPLDVAALVAENAGFAQQQRACDGLGNSVSELKSRAGGAHTEAQAAGRQVTELERMLREAQELLTRKLGDEMDLNAQLAAAQKRLDDAAAAWKATEPRRAELEQLLSRAGEHNRRSVQIAAANGRRSETQASVDRLDGQAGKLTETIDGIDKRKAEILNAAQLPVDGIELTDDGVRVGGVPFQQAAMSEQIRVALALAIAGSPGLDDVWVKQGESLDEESLDLIAQFAAAAGKRLWIERVGTRDPGVIVIHDGQVVPL
jgi:DNA repair exonuclease SbcCD ATPase subunit